MHRPRILWLLLLLPLLLCLGIAAFLVWAGTASSPLPEGLAALQSDAETQVETSPWIVFRPTNQEPTTGLILYAGGRVDPRACAPAAHALAEAGYLAVIVPVPLNLALLAPGRAEEVVAAFPDIDSWAIGGHSLGGSLAARYAHRNPQVMRGLVLWAAYPEASNDSSSRHLAAASISGSRGGLATPDEVEASRSLLPPDTEWTVIDGGNHAQFGWNGPQ